MPPPPHIKPENVLKRAQELIAVGQAPAALNVLHEHVTSKRTRSSPIASLEPVMLLFVELCVDLRKGKAAKDGLYQYKNIAQNTNVGTIEVVLKKFIELAEKKVTEAQAKADEIQSSLESAAPSSNVEDLEAIETPETILLATVSGEQSRDRTDRAVVTPWLKFLWETYRTVLEILKNNARLEVMYQTTALQAFQFCLKYTRKTEFRRLCELLRNHVQNAAKYSAQMHAINLSDPDTLQRHLDTRFQQLNVAVELELWQEAFRSIEDIHTLLSLSKRPAKNVMMANYYEKLARIFLVSENYLFHAAAFSRYYNLLRQSAATLAAGQGTKKENPSVTEADMTKAASFVLLSALSIPVISTSRSRGALVDVDEVRKNKNTRLTNLLGMASPPTRAVLFKDALNKGLLKRARPEIRDLYNILEVDFHPLSICKKITPILKQIGADPEMEKYVLPLQQVILTRLFQQLSQVYESVELKFVYELAQFPDPFQITPSMIEKFIMNGCKKGDLAIRVDHISGVLTFDTDVFSSAKALHPGSAAGSAESEVGSVQRLQNTPAEIARLQLTRLAKTLHVTCMYVDPSYNEARLQAKRAALARAEAGAAKEHEETLARRVIIEKKKEAATDALQRKQREEETRKRIRTQQLQEAEKQRLLDEHREREKKRIKDEQDRIRQQELKKQLEELKTGVKGIDISELDLNELDANRLRAMKLAQLEKEKNELNDRIRTTAKRIDHLERAFRREELKHIPEDYEKQKQRDMEIYETTKAEALKEAEDKHKEAVALKHRLSRLVPQFNSFRKEVSEKRHEEFEKRRKAAERDFEAKKKQRIKEVQERRRRERAEREEEERRRKEEEERIRREEEERTAKEEERRRVLAEEKAKREEERKRLDEIAIKQKQREEEAEARRAARRTGGAEREAAPAPERAAPTERIAPRLNLAPRTGGGPSWRERQAAKEAAGGAPAAAPERAAPEPAREEPAPVRRGYVPPHLRSGASATPAAPERAAPAPSTERYVPRAMREAGSSQPPSRTQTPGSSSDKTEESKPAAGKWVPRWKQQQGGQ
ncbi:eukaryotic translation initiation factor 3 subunit EifCa [Aspergillus piperis CBS 112811]|uniref:Eukaryotic translation initiation factor 3 subunit A n=1 Tax=Aspergillus piperis CBS 112811 TaxID=1448313 RepID=A0A8G1VQ22_9EURO|nr:eukaryotic translation initiation factor 3 subunit EifCa [Aspergillus piperis CBS 112811]RAH58313.1 eukaryotic translation initiation factor 3 subunit EifCa [Aspergillus piperis CBS 112811]